jgi:hypothetical protein
MATSSFEDRCVFHRRQNYYHFLDNLKTSLQKFYVQHHDLTDRYEISISRIIFLSSVSATTLVGLYI